jgi:hypothetical protein
MTNKLSLKPEDIIVPAELEIGNDEKLREYFDLFNRGIYEHVPPVLVIDKKSKTIENLIIKMNIRKCGQERAFRSEPSKYSSPEDLFYRIPWLSGEFYYESAVNIIKEDFLKLEKKVGNARFYLLDGNHRAIAATLNHEPIFALELEDTQDLGRLRSKMANGEYPKLFREEHNLDDLRSAFEFHCLKNLDNVFSVKQRVGELIIAGDLPRDMARRYLWELGVAV